MTVTTNSIITPQKAVSFTAIATTADVAFNAPVNVVTLVDETVVGNNDNGLRLTSIIAIPRATPIGTAINCLLYKKVGSVYTLIDSVLMPTGSPGASIANVKTDFGYFEDNPLILGAGIGLSVAIGLSAANGIVFRAHGGAY
jgi:hypothetical protein